MIKEAEALLDELSDHAADSSRVRKRCVHCGELWPCAPARAREVIAALLEQGKSDQYEHDGPDIGAAQPSA